MVEGSTVLNQCNQCHGFDYKQIFDKVDFGALIIELESRKILYQNLNFDIICKGRKQDILAFIFNTHTENPGENIKQCTFDILSDKTVFKIGISSYRIEKGNYLVFVKDISSKIISQSKKSISQFHFELSKVIAEIAHEVGNPISAVRTTLQVLKSNLENWDTKKISHFTSVTINEIERISKFLKYIKMFTLHNKIQQNQYNLKEIVRWIITTNQLYLYSNDIKVGVMIDGTLSVFIDKDAFYQVMFNLIKNAISALDGIEEKRIDISAELYNNQFVKLVFRNNGKAMDDEILKKIFTPFFSTNGKGKGLGLSIALKLMTLMNGIIEARVPKDGIGAEFVLFIPVINIGVLDYE